MEKTYPTAWHIVSKDGGEKELAEHEYVWGTKGTQTMSFTGARDSKVRCGEGGSKLSPASPSQGGLYSPAPWRWSWLYDFFGQ